MREAEERKERRREERKLAREIENITYESIQGKDWMVPQGIK